MCTIGDEDHEKDILMLNDLLESHSIGTLCRKCDATNRRQANVVLRKKDPYCKQCFLTYVTHKFRACLGKSKTMKPGDKVLIGFSGNENSVTLLHLIHLGIQDTSHKKIMFKPFIVYIDESLVLNLTKEEPEEINRKISEVLKIYDYPTYTVPLELALRPEDDVKSVVAGEAYSADDGTLTALLSSLPDLTSRLDMIGKLRHNLLAQVARAVGCNKVFTAESANDLAMKLLTNTALGRGSQLPYDVGFSDDRFSDIKVVRPLRDLSKKEIAFYKVFQQLVCVHVPSLSTKADSYSSIQKVTERFLCELQDGFPSTLSTVFRVADKLTTNAADNTCPLCNAPLDVSDTAASSVRATEFSKVISTSGPSQFTAHSLTEKSPASGCCGGGSGDQECCRGSSSNDLSPMLCYGCNLIIRNADMETLPRSVIETLQQSNQRLRMRKEIEEFLL